MIITDLRILKWLIGQWEGIHGNGIYHEEWQEINEKEFKGKAYMILKGEIRNVEKLTMHSDESGAYYIADVSHNPNPVSFKLTSLTENTFVFENPEHDFPQKITYNKKADGQLTAVVEAVKNGKVRQIEYDLKKVG